MRLPQWWKRQPTSRIGWTAKRPRPRHQFRPTRFRRKAVGQYRTPRGTGLFRPLVAEFKVSTALSDRRMGADHQIPTGTHENRWASFLSLRGTSLLLGSAGT